MSDNKSFLYHILLSFRKFISSGTSRSTAKLKPLHGAIAKDIASRLGDKYEVRAQGIGDDREANIKGRYINKKVDIAITERATGKPVAGVGVKFVMQNYSQNSNNYFENMLGETANIRSTKLPYFQIFIILDKLPYYTHSGKRTKWEEFTAHNMQKYCALATDDIDAFRHTPNKTLIFIVHITPDTPDTILTKRDYMSFYKKNDKKLCAVASSNTYEDLATDGTVILNDYEKFIDKVYYAVKAL